MRNFTFYNFALYKMVCISNGGIAPLMRTYSVNPNYRKFTLLKSRSFLSQRKIRETLQIQNFTLCHFVLNENFPFSTRYGNTTPFRRTFPTWLKLTPLNCPLLWQCKIKCTLQMQNFTLYNFVCKFSQSLTVTEIWHLWEFLSMTNILQQFFSWERERGGNKHTTHTHTHSTRSREPAHRQAGGMCGCSWDFL